MTEKRQPVQPDITSIERRERHLWLVILFLLFLLAVVTIVTFSVLVDSSSLDGRLARAVRPTALVGLLLLIGLLCAYAFQTHLTFRNIRRLYYEQALRDSLTGLLNRQSFEHRFDEAVARAKRDRKPFAILLCDLDQFKQINDSHGHHVGDKILQLVAKTALEATRGTDLVFRWGGDEFLVLVSVTTRKGALIAARRIRSGVRAIAASSQLPLDLSIGIAFFPEHSTEPRKLIRLADKALYIAKRSGDKIHVGEEEYELNERSVRMVFQPIVEVGSREVMGYEALSRDPKGKVSITKLFQRYSAVGQLAELKRIIFRDQIRAAHEHRLDKVFINIDFETLQTIDPFAKPENVEVILEISEADSLSDVEGHLETADSWRRLGYKFAIDDFGSGFMSLPFIAKLVPEYIKVDRSTIVEAAASEQFRRFLRDLVRAVRNYSKDGIIAEGIETEEEFEVVREMGVDQVQGYLTGRPTKWKSP
ncbi:MAG: diguanylate cyclase [Acidobacteria bacterium]|nr:diguanylate cyclase [Acidobacteriota bacterium]